jgi:hypothetical protein
VTARPTGCRRRCCGARPVSCYGSCRFVRNRSARKHRVRNRHGQHHSGRLRGALRKTRVRRRGAGGGDGGPAVDGLRRSLDHPLRTRLKHARPRVEGKTRAGRPTRGRTACRRTLAAARRRVHRGPVAARPRSAARHPAHDGCDLGRHGDHGGGGGDDPRPLPHLVRSLRHAAARRQRDRQRTYLQRTYLRRAPLLPATRLPASRLPASRRQRTTAVPEPRAARPRSLPHDVGRGPRGDHGGGVHVIPDRRPGQCHSDQCWLDQCHSAQRYLDQYRRDRRRPGRHHGRRAGQHHGQHHGARYPCLQAGPRGARRVALPIAPRASRSLPGQPVALVPGRASMPGHPSRFLQGPKLPGSKPSGVVP